MRQEHRVRSILAFLVIAGVSVAACSGSTTGGSSASAGSSSAGQSAEAVTLVVSIWDQGAPFQAPVIATQPDLQKMIPAQISWVPINAAPPTLAAMKAGSFDIVSLVGNPPVVAAIGNGTDMRIVNVESFDNESLVVNPSIKSPADMAGKTFADLVGSSDDYAFRGWLKSQGLDTKVTIVEVSGQETIASAFATGKIDGAYVDEPQAIQMKKAGGIVLATSADAQKAGYSGVNVMVVRGQDVETKKAAIQGFVCADLAATRLLLGTTADDVMRQAAQVTGQKPEDSVGAGHAQPPVPNSDVLAQLAGTTGNIADSPLVSNYVQTSAFLVALGKLASPITADQVVKVIDPSFVQAALNGGCN